ncbi:SBBP repeat-containing protein [Telluribacter sp. SYSU D00476]|uniref:SBBP repeat-containing protein n=1 Tax=Telluribacter sp. SYSU D00476 TaxID=2811430 RepID=UPI001FF2EEF9|nr:SBBP repeat-containing protein [Telluribacter sp. SYSU D00476]
MKKIAILLTSLLIAFISGCQDHNLEPHPEDVMAWQAGGPGYDIGTSIAVDKSGNIYTTGHFKGTATFGTTTLTSKGEDDVFIVKYNSNGDVLWAKNEGGVGYDLGQDISVDINGNVYVIGRFQKSATFGTTTIVSNGSIHIFDVIDIFIAKYSSNGEFQWVQQLGGNGNDFGQSITVDESGNVYVTGYFGEKITVGSTTLNSNDVSDVFVAKYNTNGEGQWVKIAASLVRSFGEVDEGQGITVDKSGNVYVTGIFNGTIFFGTTPLTSSGASDIFIAKYNATGDLQWAQRAGGSRSDRGNSITVDQNNNIYVTGYFHHNATFGSKVLLGEGGPNFFLAKYSSSGDIQWVQNIENANGLSIALDNKDDVYISGNYSHIATFGTTTFTTASIFDRDMFIAKYNSMGAFQWAQTAGAKNGLEDGLGVAVDEDKNVYVIGTFLGPATFGTTTLNSSGSNNIFVAKYKQ